MQATGVGGEPDVANRGAEDVPQVAMGGVAALPGEGSGAVAALHVQLHKEGPVHVIRVRHGKGREGAGGVEFDGRKRGREGEDRGWVAGVAGESNEDVDVPVRGLFGGVGRADDVGIEG